MFFSSVFLRRIFLVDNGFNSPFNRRSNIFWAKYKQRNGIQLRANKYVDERCQFRQNHRKSMVQLNEMLLDMQIRYKILRNMRDDNMKLKKYGYLIDELEVIFSLLYNLKDNKNFNIADISMIKSDLSDCLSDIETLFENVKKNSHIKPAKKKVTRSLNILKYDLADLSLSYLYTHDSHNLKSDYCPRCKKSEDLVYLKCGHGYHLPCLYKQILNQGPECCNCKKQIYDMKSPNLGLDIQ